MTADRRKALADRLFAEHIYTRDYIRADITLFSLLPTGYGALTWIFGDDLWSGSEVYKTALSAPGAPQSWGTLFVALGVTLAVMAARRRYRVVAVVSAATSLMMALFMVMFVTEYVARSNESALPPALAWAVFSLLLLNLSRLGLKMSRLERAYGKQELDGGG